MLFDVDVLPHVDLGPVREREDADAFARSNAAVQQVPQLRPLVLGIPLALRVAQREDPLLGARSLLVAPSAAERGVEIARLERVEQRLGLEQSAAALRADQERLRAVGNRLLVGVDDQPGADLGGVPVRGTRSSRGTCRSCRRAAAGTGIGPGWNAFCASRSRTDESLPIE